MKREKILVNSVQCGKCGDIIVSRYTWDFVSCKCGKIAVDGGRDYLKRCGDLDGYTELSVVEEIEN
jgi:hypothetical protein